MPTTFSRGALACQPMDVDHVDAARSTSVDHESLPTLRQVIADFNYSLDALQAAMGKDRSFINKVLNGEKPMPPDFIDALPDDIEAEWHVRRARRFGHFVAAPSSDESAVQDFVGGLLTMLRANPQLPVKASSMAKARRRA